MLVKSDERGQVGLIRSAIWPLLRDAALEWSRFRACEPAIGRKRYNAFNRCVKGPHEYRQTHARVLDVSAEPASH